MIPRSPPPEKRNGQETPMKKHLRRRLRIAALAAAMVLAASLSHSQTTYYYPDQEWGSDAHLLSQAYRDNGFDGGAFEPEGGNTVTVCTRLSIRAKESGPGSSTIDVVLYRWGGSDWDEHVRATVNVDGGTYAWCSSAILADTLPSGYYRLGCCGAAGNSVTVQCTTDPLAEADAFVKPLLSTCPNPWGILDETMSLDDLNIYMTYTEEVVEKAKTGRRRRAAVGEGNK